MKNIFRIIFVIVCVSIFISVITSTSYADNVSSDKISYIAEIESGSEHESESEPEDFEDEYNSMFNINKDSARIFYCDGETITLYTADIVMDLNYDGKTNIADARVLLRIAAELETTEFDSTLCDISADGLVTASDARLLLRYALELDLYYADEKGMNISGWVVDEDSDLCYFYENGMLAIGYKEIDNNYYFFNSSGKVCYGKVNSSSDVYYFNEKGCGVNGFKTIDNSRYYFINGKAQKGLVTIDGTVYGFAETGEMLKGLNKIGGDYYYFSKYGKAQTGWITTDNNKYYFGSDYKAVTGKQIINSRECVFSDSGILINGYIDENKNTYYYDNGSPYSGWLYKGLDSYYFYSDGRMAKDTTIGDASFNKEGIASCDKLSTDTLQIYVRDILKSTGTSTKSIYNYVYYNYRYKYYAKSSPDSMVLRMLQNKRGACYDYAYLTKYLLEAAGYECYIVVGDSFNTANGNEHDWVLVKVDGVWRHMDTQKGAYLKTDEQMTDLGYKWPSKSYPAAE